VRLIDDLTVHGQLGLGIDGELEHCIIRLIQGAGVGQCCQRGMLPADRKF
jgi:hypothetical protein